MRVPFTTTTCTDREANTKFLQIEFSSGKKIEITANHMLFVDKVGLMPAGRVQPGDFLVTPDHQDSAEQVVSVRKIWSKGAYAPITTTGDIFIGGVAASNFVELSPVFSSHLSFEQQEWMQRAALKPCQFFCRIVGCESETYDEAKGLTSAVMFWVPMFGWLQTDGQFLLPVLSFLVTVVAEALAYFEFINLALSSVGYKFWMKLSIKSKLNKPTISTHPSKI